MKKTRIIALYSKENKYSMNTVIAIIDKTIGMNNIIITRNYDDFINLIKEYSNKSDLVIGLQSLMTTQIPILMENNFFQKFKGNNWE